MYRLPDLTEIQKDLLMEFNKLSDTIAPTSERYRQLSKRHWDSIAKPLDSLGEFEKIFQKLSAIYESEIPDISNKCITVMCADNGIVKEGISQSNKDVTLAVAKSMAIGTSSIAVLCKSVNSKLMVFDMGIDSFDTEMYSLGVLNHKLMHGSNNFLKEKAMPLDITIRAILTGINTVKELKENKVTVIGTGEMGIGNTTTSSALSAAMLNLPVETVTGRGAGLDDTKLILDSIISDDTKVRVLAILDLLSSVGGLDIAAITGVFIGGGIYKLPIIIDGVISEVAAALAYFLNPLCKEYMLASHLSREPVASIIFDMLKLNPVIDASLALGEGSGCAMFFSLLDMIFEIYTKNACFSDIKIDKYKRFV